MKKKLLFISLLLMASLTGFAKRINCIDSNIEYNGYCCIPVGDGTKWSCTDGSVWFLIDSPAVILDPIDL